MSVDDRQNKKSLKQLRGRMVTRAGTLLVDREFQLAIREVRRDWNLAFPKYALAPNEMAPDSLSAGAWNPSHGVFLPDPMFSALAKRETPPFRDYAQATLDIWVWCQHVDDMRSRFFRRDLFPWAMWDRLISPASAFISACLVFDLVSIDPQVLFPEPLLPIAWLPYPPMPEQDVAYFVRQAGRASVLENALRRVLGDESDALAEIMEAADVEADASYARLDRPWGELGVGQPASDRWHFIPLGPDVAAEDLRRILQVFGAFSSRTFGTSPVNAMIQQLVDEGLSQEEIARLLGVSLDTVSRAPKRARP
ncbi:MAG: helix-turn-helix domain-containing protein [Thermomicrobiales bacterium]